MYKLLLKLKQNKLILDALLHFFHFLPLIHQMKKMKKKASNKKICCEACEASDIVKEMSSCNI